MQDGGEERQVLATIAAVDDVALAGAICQQQVMGTKSFPMVAKDL